MAVLRLSAGKARLLVESPDLHRSVGAAVGVPVVVVQGDGSDLTDVARALTALPVIALATGDTGADHGWDLHTDDPEPVVESIENNPLAAVTLAQVLRLTPRLGTADGLVVESLAYSALQGGPEHARWLAARGRRVRPEDPSPRVRMDDHPDRIDIVMTRPKLRNLIDVELRDQLVDAFKTATADDRPVRLLGEGTCFCGGGDPAEFGTADDPATSNLIRGTANIAPWTAGLASRLTAVIDGPCIGAGVELAAFAHRIVATPKASFRMPETSMGLMPGAGGTVSIPRRIGAPRTLELLLRDTVIAAEEALEYGLVDVIVDTPHAI